MVSNKKTKINYHPNTQRQIVVSYDVESYKKSNFRWSVNTKYLCNPQTCGYKCKDKCFSLYKAQNLFDIFGKLDEYRSWTWRDIESKNGTSTGFMEICQLDTKDMIQHHFTNLKFDYDVIYKVEISGKHRVWGIRQNDELFIIWDDPEHRFYKHTNKNYS